MKSIIHFLKGGEQSPIHKNRLKPNIHEQIYSSFFSQNIEDQSTIQLFIYIAYIHLFSTQNIISTKISSLNIK